MALVLAYIPDLLFGSRVRSDLQAAGHDVIDHPHGVPGPPECVDDV